MEKLKTWLGKLNNEQIKHLAMSFRIFGVAIFLGTITKSDNYLEMIVLAILWVIMEFCGIIVLDKHRKE